ncbi:thiamine diphosphokinase [Aminicella lysinilytica]|jgi:thiamine pyrophosphokinase|uniref:thiamine diphosphokinase n=1 Tax=Aminicella lysinilytica TaxID=433323 RepID=UPI0026F26D20|nr:thiamine diphosphokinase [Aminicella lysinilytica]
MNKCLIITSHVDAIEKLAINSADYDCVICADGGLLVANKLKITPDLLIGDYDSMAMPENTDLIKLPMEKNMTDSEAAIDLAVSKGYDDITVLGGLGGRFDHTMGNIGMLAKYSGSNTGLAFVDGCNRVFMLEPGTYEIPKSDHRYLGLIAYGGTVTSLTIKGVKYPLVNHLLTDDTTLGVSNEILSDSAHLNFRKGRLLVILSSDVDNQQI